MAQEHTDPFSPVLRNAVTPHAATEEQERLIVDVLNLSSSDSRFAQKANAAIRLILAGGSLSPIPPVITSLSPATGVAGSPPPPLKVRVLGSGFDATCKIYVNDLLVNTTFVSPAEVFTNVALSGITGANVWPVVVRNGAGVTSNTAVFTITA